MCGVRWHTLAETKVADLEKEIITELSLMKVKSSLKEPAIQEMKIPHQMALSSGPRPPIIPLSLSALYQL